MRGMAYMHCTKEKGFDATKVLYQGFPLKI